LADQRLTKYVIAAWRVYQEAHNPHADALSLSVREIVVQGTRKPQVVVVTGASAGVGRAVAQRFGRDGDKVALIARGFEGLAAAAREVEDAGGQPLVTVCDVSDAAAVEQAASVIETSLGPIDIWINAAFAGVVANFMDISHEDYVRVTDVTYHGQVNGTRAALKRMSYRNRGSIVLVGSALAYRGIPLQSAYCGAKHAIQGFHDSLRSELFSAKSRVRVSMVQLPGVNTPQFDWIKTTLPQKPRPASPPYQPEVAAGAIHFAARSRRKQLLVGFPTLEAVWGDLVASPLLDRYLGRAGISGQKDVAPIEADRRGNLWEPVPGDRGTHGRFDGEARRFSMQLWVSTHRWQIAAGLAGTVAAAGLRRFRRKS
jgi:NAD(P)-dependent dehydrogenase (short-subunit alcohol dehydrogenase family)